MKKFSLIPVFFAISIVSVFIFSFPAKVKAQECNVESNVGRCGTCEDANIPAPAEPCDCDTNNGVTIVMTGILDWTGNKAVGSCGSEIWDASCHTNCEKSFTCFAPPAYYETEYDASGTAYTVRVCPSGTWKPGCAYCITSWCDEGETLKETCLPWETATYATKPNLTCDDEKCSMTAWTALADGDCEQTFAGSPAVFQICPLHCECWGQCMAPVTNYHYYDGEGELDWGKDCSKFTSTSTREKCEILNKYGINLPVSFGWNMPTMSGERGVFPYDKYWLNKTLNSDVQSLIVKIDGKERFLTADELLNVTKFNSEIGETKAKQLENFKKKCLNGAYPDGFLEFLQTWNPSVHLSPWWVGLFEPRPNDLDMICKYKDSQRLNQILYFIYFTEFGDAVGKPGSTFNYSISQDKKFGPCTLNSDKGYEWSARLCCGTDKTNCGPPSKVKEPPQTPSPYPPGSNKQFFKTSPAPEPVGILVSTMVKKGWETSTVTTIIDPVTGHEVEGYLPQHFTANAIRWIDTDWNRTTDEAGFDTSIKLYKGDYVDPEWCSVTTTETFQKNGRRYFIAGPPYYKLRTFYNDLLTLSDPKEEIEKKKEEIKARGINPTLRCEDPNKAGFCQKSKPPNLVEDSKKTCYCYPFPCPHPCLKDQFCPELNLENEICYPGLGRIGSPRREWDVRKYLGKSMDDIKSMNSDELQWEMQKLVERNCVGYTNRSAYGEKLAKEEAIIITEDPYLPLEYANGVEYKPKGTEWHWWNPLTYPNLFKRKQYSIQNLGRPWNWDYQTFFFSHSNDKPIDWQIGVINGNNDIEEPKVYSQKWNLQLLTWPIKKWDFGKQEMVEIEPITKISISPPSEKNEIDSIPVVNRLQILTWHQIERALSYYLTFSDEDGETIPIPKEFSLVRKPEGPASKESYSLSTKLNNIWPELKKQDRDQAIDESDPNFYRLNRDFTLIIQPCWDERGERCDNTNKLTLRQPFKTTGAPTTGLEPGLDITINKNPDSKDIPKKKIPRYLDWDAMPGAVSYWYDIKGPTALKGETPELYVYANLKGGEAEEGDFTWTVRTCADTCDKENTLQCGTSSDEMLFHGCELNPPKKPESPNLGEQFYSASSTYGGDTIRMSWHPVSCGISGADTDTPMLYQYELKYAAPFDCRGLSKELKQQCEDIQNSTECRTLLANPQIILLDDLAKNALPDNMTTKPSLPAIQLKCLGTYNWKMRACLEHDSAGCKEEEAGDWSSFGYFNVVLEKAPPLPAGGAGIGTCHDLIPCKWGECKFTDIPKLIENIINCILWTLFPIALFGLVVYTGIAFYFAMGAPETLEKVKSIWKAGGKGFLWMFLAWTILNLIFQVLGWRTGSFGDWFNPVP